MPKEYRLLQVPPQEIDFSDSNPRGESEETIHSDKDFEQLKDSVHQFGVLVPVVVHEIKPHDGKKYRLVDGERRLRAALATGQKIIPAHVASGVDKTADIVQAFHIHMLRKQWRNVAVTRALKSMMTTLRAEKPSLSPSELTEQLREITGCSETKLKALRRAARYSEEVLSDVDKGRILWSHLVQFEESFIEPVEQNFPKFFEEIGKKKVREALLRKATIGVLSGTRALMVNIVPVIARAESTSEKAYAKELLIEFLAKDEMTAENVLARFESKFPSSKEDIVRRGNSALEYSEGLRSHLAQLDPDDLSSFPSLKKQLEESLTAVRKLLQIKLQKFRSLLD